VDRVVALLQVEHPFRRARHAPAGDEADVVAGAGTVEAVKVLQPQRPLLDREPAELPGVVVDRALRVGVPAEGEQLEDVVAV